MLEENITIKLYVYVLYNTFFTELGQWLFKHIEFKLYAEISIKTLNILISRTSNNDKLHVSKKSTSKMDSNRIVVNFSDKEEISQ